MQQLFCGWSRQSHFVFSRRWKCIWWRELLGQFAEDAQRANERGDSTMKTSPWTTLNKKFGSQHHPRSLVSFETLPVRLVHVACYQLESKYVKGVKQSTLVFKERVIRKIDNHLFMAYREFNFQIDWRKPKCRCKIGVQTQFLERHQTICTTRLPTIIAKITRSSQNHNQVSPTSISTDVPKSSSACCK